MPRKIIIDCGPGHDDAMAILLAHGNPEIELCAITTVAGNQTLEKTTPERAPHLDHGQHHRCARSGRLRPARAWRACSAAVATYCW